MEKIMKSIIGLVFIAFLAILLSTNANAEYSDVNIEIEKFQHTPDDLVQFTIIVEGEGTFNINITNEENLKIKDGGWKNQNIKDFKDFNYQIPKDIKDGFYRINVYDLDKNSTVSTHLFEIHAISLDFETDSTSYLPGSQISIFYSISWIKDGTGVNNANLEYNITYWKQYAKEEFGILKPSYINKKISSKTSFGNFEIKLPDDAIPGMNGAPCKLTIKVNTSDDKHTTNLVKEFYIAPPYINVKIIDEKNQYNFDDFLIVKAEAKTGREYWTGYTNSKKSPESYNNRVVFFSNPELIESNGSLYKYGYIDGNSIWLNDIPSHNYLPVESISPLKESIIDLKIVKKENENTYSDTKYKTEGLRTDALGDSIYIFTLGDDLKAGEYLINVTLKGTPISGKNSKSSKDFKINKDKQMILSISANKQIFSQNENVVVSYFLYYGEQHISGDANIDYVVSYENSEYIYAYGRTKNTPGSFSFLTPNNFEGNMKIEVTLTNSTGEKTASNIIIEVHAIKIIFNSDNLEFNPGDTISANFEIYGGTNFNIFYTILMINENNYIGIIDKVLNTNDYDIVSYGKNINGTRAKKIVGTILYPIPENGTADLYKIKLYAIDNNNGNYAEKEIVFNISPFTFLIEFDKNIYKPGDTVKIKYEIISKNDNKIDKSVKFNYGIAGFQENFYESFEAKGEIEFTIPNEIPDGNYVVIINEQNFGLTSIQNLQVEANSSIPWFEIMILIIAFFSLIVGFSALISVNKGQKRFDQSVIESKEKDENLSNKDSKKKTQKKKMEEKKLNDKLVEKHEFQDLIIPITPVVPTEKTQQDSETFEKELISEDKFLPPPPPDSTEQKASSDFNKNEIKTTKCPRCKGVVPIYSSKRPVDIKCSNCGLEGTLE